MSGMSDLISLECFNSKTGKAVLPLGVASLIAQLSKTMRYLNQSETEVAEMQRMVCFQFGIMLPENFGLGDMSISEEESLINTIMELYDRRERHTRMRVGEIRALINRDDLSESKIGRALSKTGIKRTICQNRAYYYF